MPGQPGLHERTNLRIPRRRRQRDRQLRQLHPDRRRLPADDHKVNALTAGYQSDLPGASPLGKRSASTSGQATAPHGSLSTSECSPVSSPLVGARHSAPAVPLAGGAEADPGPRSSGCESRSMTVRSAFSSCPPAGSGAPRRRGGGRDAGGYARASGQRRAPGSARLIVEPGRRPARRRHGGAERCRRVGACVRVVTHWSSKPSGHGVGQHCRGRRATVGVIR